MTLCVPLMIFGYNIDAFMGVSGVWLAVPVLVVAAILRYSYLAPMFAVTQKLVEPRMRATAAALLLFVVNLIGYGFGPPVVGAISDAGSRWQLSQLDASVTLSECGAIEKELKAGTVTIPDAETLNESFCKPARKTGVRIGVTTGALFFLWAALHFLLMGKTLQRDQWTPEKDAATA
jgi:hypothetical protein